LNTAAKKLFSVLPPPKGAKDKKDYYKKYLDPEETVEYIPAPVVPEPTEVHEPEEFQDDDINGNMIEVSTTQLVGDTWKHNALKNLTKRNPNDQLSMMNMEPSKTDKKKNQLTAMVHDAMKSFNAIEEHRTTFKDQQNNTRSKYGW